MRQWKTHCKPTPPLLINSGHETYTKENKTKNLTGIFHLKITQEIQGQKIPL